MPPDEDELLLDRVFVGLWNLLMPAVRRYEDLPDPPTPEPPVIRDLPPLDDRWEGHFVALEAEFARRLPAIGWSAKRGETLRTDERQEWLYGIGRSYKAPGRTGIVTNARKGKGPHTPSQRRAVDYNYVATAKGADKSRLEMELDAIARDPRFAAVLTWGGHFKSLRDVPHWEGKL